MTNDDKYYVYFTPKVRNAKDGQGGRSKDAYEWLSLRGHDRVHLLNKLPTSLPLILPGGLGTDLKQLWEVCPISHGFT